MAKRASLLADLILLIDSYSTPLVILLLLASLAAGTYIRMVPALNYGLELDEADPWEMYWIAEQLYQKGLFNFESVSDSKLFWYPYGRNFLTREYIGTAWVAAATYHVVKFSGISLRDWIALFPVIAGVLTSVLAFIFVYIITRSKVGALTSAALFSLLPGAIGRSTVGFVEKMVMASVLIVLLYIFLAMALRSEGRRSLLYAALAGSSAGSVTFFWGGYHFVSVSLALIIFLDPLVRGRADEGRLKIYGLTTLTFVLLTLLYPAVGYTYFVGNLGLAVIASLLFYAVAVYWERLGFSSRLFPLNRALYLWALATTFIVGAALLATETIRVPGRILLALGIREFSPLVESVAEHTGVAWGELFRELGIPFLLTIMGTLYYAYRIYSGRRDVVDHLVIGMFLMSFMMMYAAKNMAYFLQMASFYVSIAAGISIGAWMAGERMVSEGKRFISVDEVRFVVALFLIAMVAGGSVYYAKNSYDTNYYRAPQILTSGLSAYYSGGKILVPINDAWQRTLEYLRTNTSEDSLIVSWWDYGYWISVGANRPTVADGSTQNETQIRLLARILTGNEDEASALLPMLGARPNKTYLVFYEAFVFVKPQNSTTIYGLPIPNSQRQGNIYVVTYGLADFPKSFQMLRISYRINPYAETFVGTQYSSQTVSGQVRAYHFPALAGSPESNVRLTLNSLLYKLSMEGLAAIPMKGLMSKCSVFENATIVIPTAFEPSTGQLIPAIPSSFSKRFVPEAFMVSCFHKEDTFNGLQEQAVVVFIYKWIG
ncbi:MAG: STT3 domain-containing protein [Acidilobaceae archaeon]